MERIYEIAAEDLKSLTDFFGTPVSRQEITQVWGESRNWSSISTWYDDHVAKSKFLERGWCHLHSQERNVDHENTRFPNVLCSVEFPTLTPTSESNVPNTLSKVRVVAYCFSKDQREVWVINGMNLPLYGGVQLQIDQMWN